jgi:acetylornithine deacetylase/succinyl-diaminopimelate desuccinylase-like protein
MCRLTLSQEDKETRDWLVEECKSLGCQVKVDQMGNIFAIRPGTAKDRKPIGMGSHMDTQPAGTSAHSVRMKKNEADEGMLL